MSRYDDPSWYEEPERSLANSQRGEVEDLNQPPSLYMPANDRVSSAEKQTNTSSHAHRFFTRSMLGYVLVLIAFMIVAFIGGWFCNQFFGPSFTESSQSKTYSQLFQQAWNTIDQQYVDRKAVDYKTMSYAAINAMVATLHDTGHTRFLTPAEVQSENQQLSGKFTGIGIYLHQDQQTKQLIINSAIPGSPAEKAGLKHGDVIIQVNGTNVEGKDLPSVSKLITGNPGTFVTITIQRPGTTSPLTFRIARAQIAVPNVTFHYIAESHIAHIQIIQFSYGVTDQLRTAVDEAKRMGATSIILDLRDNPGGYLDEAIHTVSLFQKSGNVLLVQDSSGQRSPMAVTGNPVDTQIPIIVLVNENSASAAEITAGALKDSHRALIMGVKTFGTGTVLQQYSLSDGSALLIGTQEWLTPSGQFIRDKGIQPNIVVQPSKTNTVLSPTLENESKLDQQQIMQNGDTQLNAAIQYLSQHK